MKTQIELRSHHTITKLRKAIKNSNDEAQKTRIRAIINIKKGRNRLETQETFLIDRSVLRRWIKAYNTGGIDALVFSKGGRPKGNHKWDQSIFDALIKEIDKGGKCWSIPLMQDWIEIHHGKDIPVQTVWYHMGKLDYSYKSSRPHPYKGDKKKQEVFKKRAWLHT